MPFPGLKVPLQVEIFTTDVDRWKKQIIGQPIMAEHWLIGDGSFRNELEQMVPGLFEAIPLEIVSFLRKTPQAMRRKKTEGTGGVPIPGPFFSFHATQEIYLDRGLKGQYPPIECPICKRSIPDIPFDVAVIPDVPPSRPTVGFMVELLFEGYDYIFHESIVSAFQTKFPKMLFEEMNSEPLLF